MEGAAAGAALGRQKAVVQTETGPAPGRLTRGDRRACVAFVDAHYRPVFRFFRWLGCDPASAEDLTQETFAGFWESLGRREGTAELDPKAWLYGIARNRWRKRLRRERARPSAALEEAEELSEPGSDPSGIVIGALEAERVLTALRGLPPELREALVLRVFEELTYEQIAEALLIRPGLARWRVHRARRLLTARLGAGEGEADE